MASNPLVFDWDQGNIRHLARHGVSPQEAEECYRNDPLVLEEQPFDDETRFLALSENDATLRLALVFTLRSNRIGLITAIR
jgi:uncharacterized DUF497 family protein